MTSKSYNVIPSTTFSKSCWKAWPEIEKLVNNTVNNGLLQTEDKPPENNLELLNYLMKLASPGDGKILQQDVEEWVTGDDNLDHKYILVMNKLCDKL